MNCTACTFDVPSEMSFCPHCGQPGIFPNVVAAGLKAEEGALDDRYNAVILDAVARGAVPVLAQFEAAAANSLAVRNVGELELRSLTASNQMMSTFERMQDAELSAKANDEWTPNRLTAGASLFPNYQQEIRYGAIALGPNPAGVQSYGPFTLVLKEPLIAGRSTVFITNSARIVRSSGMSPNAKISELGDRATWANRAKLAVVKCGPAIVPTTAPADFYSMLLGQASSSGAEEYVELHVFRPMTIRTVARILVHLHVPGAPKRSWSKTILRQVNVDLRKAATRIQVEVF
jgi:hypothetical protein